MARMRPARGGRSTEETVARHQVVQPDYYEKFRCIGPDCEDSCCIGWRVDIDRDTWQRYQACTNETLAPLFRDRIELEPRHDVRSTRRYATVRFLPNRRCPFLRDDMLCMIQNELGARALSNTCASYPRFVNQFGQQQEYGLGVSCPEAARIILLHAEPTRLVMADVDPEIVERKIANHVVTAKPKDVPVLNQLRVLTLRLLQWRELTLGARMMLLGLLLDEIGRIRGNPRFKSVNEFVPAMETYAALFADPAYVEAEFERLPGNLPRKIECTTGFLADFLTSVDPRFKECILAFADGLLGAQAGDATGDISSLLARYQKIYDEYYLPYFREKDFVLENYLVNEVLVNLFPFVRGNSLELYRALVFNLAIIQVMLVGIAGHDKGLSDARVIQFIQTFARRSAHNDSYICKLTEAIVSKESPTFVEVMWMLKER